MRTLALAVALALSAVSAPAFAQPMGDPPTAAAKADHWGSGIQDGGTHRRPQQLAVMALLSYWNLGFGGGVRYTIPLLHDGFLPQLNESFDLEFGADAYFGFLGYFGLMPVVELRWAFYVLANLALYVKAGIGVDFGFGRVAFAGLGFFYFWPVVTGGLLYKLSDGLDLKVEAGWPGVRVGVAFNIF